jgi:osmotically-inducible protein OsmY
MKPVTATLLAAMLSAAFASASAQNSPATTAPAPAAEGATDRAAYRTHSEKAAEDYRAASKACTGNKEARQLCLEEAKVARAQANLDAVSQYNNTKSMRLKMRTELANAHLALERARCAALTSTEKSECQARAKATHTAALADAKADRDIRTTVASRIPSPVTGTDTTDPQKRAAIEKCEQLGGNARTACLIDQKGRATALIKDGQQAAQKTENMAERAAERTRETTSNVAANTERAAETAAARTERAAETAAAKTERGAENLAAKTERAAETAAVKTERAAETAAVKTERGLERAGDVVEDSVITAKIKAEMIREPDLKALSIDVDTKQGVVMLSGMVASKAEADKAVRVARSVKGVSSVKNNLKVK